MSNIALYNALTKLGVEPEQAEAAASDVASRDGASTKSDIVKVEAAISNIRTELKYIRWFLGFLFATQLAIVGVLVALFRLLVA